MRGCEEIHQVWAVGAAAHHVEVEITLNLIHMRIVLRKIARAQQSLLLTVPKCKYHGTLGLYTTRHKRLHYLQNCRYTRCIVISSIVYLVALKVGIHTLMVEMSTYHNHLVGFLSWQYCKHIAKMQGLMHLFLNLGYRIGFNKKARTTL